MKIFKLSKIAVILIMAVVFLSSCAESETYLDGEYKSFATMINHCKGTTVVIGISEMDGYRDMASINISVIDSTGTVYSCLIGGTLGLHIGDTIK